MTEQELKIFRLHCQLAVHEVALSQLLKALAAIAGDEQTLPAMATAIRKISARTVVKDADPAMSQLLAAENEEVVERFLAGLK